MTGVFRRPFRRAQRRRIVHGVAAVVQAPGLHRRRQPMAVRRFVRVRQTVAFVVGGIGRAVPVIPIARMLMERRGKIMRERMARKPVMLTAPLVVVGATLFPARPFIFRPSALVRSPARIPVTGVPAPVVPSSTPFPARRSFRRLPRRTLPQRIFTVPTSVPVGEVTVCTSGAWSTVISFVACDSYRLVIDGPALNNPKVGVTMEFEE